MATKLGPHLNRSADSKGGHVNRPETWNTPAHSGTKPPGDKIEQPSGKANSRPEAVKGDW